MCLLEDRRARHFKANAEHSSGTASPAAGVRLVRIDRAEPLFQKPPIDRPRQLRQGMAHIRGLVEPRPEKIVLSPNPAAPSAASNHPPPGFQRQRITTNRAVQFAGKWIPARRFLASSILAAHRNRPENRGVQDSSRATNEPALGGLTINAR